MAMPHRTLGNDRLEVSALGLGTMGMTMAYGPSNDDEGIATLQRAFELGVTFFDTAELYGMGTGSNERLLGKAVAGFRDEVVLATKFGFDLSDPANFSMGVDSRPENIRKVAEQSLKDLGTDRIDLFYQHRVDPSVPIEEVAGAVKKLVDAGKVLHFGLSEAGPDTIRRAHAVLPVTALQTEYSIFERDVEAEVLPVARELGIGFVPYSPLGRGFLTTDVKRGGSYPEGDMRNSDPRFQGEAFDANVRAVDQLRDLAESREVTVAQLALAWLLAQGNDVVPIPGTRNAKRLAENVGAADVTLTEADLARIDEILPTGAVGARYAGDYTPDWSVTT